MVQTFNGSPEQYEAYCAEQNRRERAYWLSAYRAEHDPGLQCPHGVSLYSTCRLDTCATDDLHAWIRPAPSGRCG